MLSSLKPSRNQCLPNSHEVCIVGVVVALEGCLAGLVPPISPVLHQECCAFKYESVDTHLRVDVELKNKLIY